MCLCETRGLGETRDFEIGTSSFPIIFRLDTIEYEYECLYLYLYFVELEKVNFIPPKTSQGTGGTTHFLPARRAHRPGKDASLTQLTQRRRRVQRVVGGESSGQGGPGVLQVRGERNIRNINCPRPPAQKEIKKISLKLSRTLHPPHPRHAVRPSPSLSPWKHKKAFREKMSFLKRKELTSPTSSLLPPYLSPPSRPAQNKYL